MNFVELIEKKKQGKQYSEEEINFIVNSIKKGSVADSQIAAWLVTVSFNGLCLSELADLSLALAKSGESPDLRELGQRVFDKQSTGGVGDKLSVTLLPLLVAAGIPIVKIINKGFGNFSGTQDKLESIPGFKSNYSSVAIINQVKNTGGVYVSQSDTYAPVDKKLFEIRNLTATLDSQELIVSSLISQKLASGADCVLYDIKFGSGTLLKTAEDAINLSNLITKVSEKLNKKATIVVSSMEEPLGRAIGNSLEVIEGIEFLKGNIKTGDLAELTYYIASIVLIKYEMFNNIESATNFLTELIDSGKAIDKFREIISAQGGNTDVINNYDKFTVPSFKIECTSKKDGYIQSINAENIGKSLAILGGIRKDAGNGVDNSVGIYLNKKSGEYVQKGNVLYTIYSNDTDLSQQVQNYCDEAFLINNSKPTEKNIVYKVFGIEDENV